MVKYRRPAILKMVDDGPLRRLSRIHALIGKDIKAIDVTFG